MKKIRKVLVANRGEIAVRIMRSCKEMNIKTVAVYSDVDRISQHVFYADEAVCIGKAPSSESYLSINNIIEAAQQCKADAIHPGYGFLSESAVFAERCADEGIIFIGPSPEAMRAMGDKIRARQTMIKAGVPVVPGRQDNLSNMKDTIQACKEIGFPILLKASAGGGGKGMRLIRNENEIEEAFALAKSEAKASFGDDTVYIEKYIESPHHIEFQILGDEHGNIIHLYERECSIQRRYQKIIEETPSPFITQELRTVMGQKAIEAAKAVNYVGAGTIEFLVDKNFNYYFLEMNTRLQVEHPITEQVLGIDLVKEQIHIANGMPLRFKQEEIVQRGHAIECRICAEDAENNFMPAPGTINQITIPLGAGVRIDSYAYEGYEIPVHYDPMIGKLIVWAVTREYAIERLQRALFEYKITGIKNNIRYLRKIIDTPDFISGNYDTHFIEKNSELLKRESFGRLKITVENIAIIAAYIDYLINTEENISKVSGGSNPVSRWKEFGKRKIMRLN